MAKYRKKPVVIDAVKYDPEDVESIKVLSEFLNDCQGWKMVETGISLPTLEGETIASFGDFIIRGVKGEFYACKPDIFELTYEPVEE